MPLTGAAAGVLRLTAVYLLLRAAVGGAAQDGDGVVLFGGIVLRRTEGGAFGHIHFTLG